MAFPYIGPTIWSKTPGRLSKKTSQDVQKQNLKEDYLEELKNFNSR